MAGNLGPTYLDLITESLSILGVYAAGEPIDASDLATCLFTLTALIDGSGAEPLTIYDVTPTTYATVAGQQTYLLGPAGATPANDWITPALPSTIGDMAMMSGDVELPVSIRTEQEWARNFTIKDLPGGSFVTDAWVKRGAGAIVFNLWPVPSVAFPVVLYFANAVQKPTDATNVLVLPPGYQEWLQYELAMKVASKFSAPIPAYLPEALADAKFKVKAQNYTALVSSVDSALTGGGSGAGLIGFYTGQ